MERDNRSEERLPARLQVTVISGTVREELFTEDVSYRGVFIRTDTPRRAGELVILEIDGPNGEELELAGKVVHIIAPKLGSPRVPGIGLQLYGLRDDVRGRWMALVDYIRGEQRSIHAKPVEPDEHIRRRFPRIPSVLRVNVQNMRELTNLYTVNVSKGGMFIETDAELKLGQSLALEIMHPRTANSFAVEAIVRRTVDTGVGVEFIGLKDQDRHRFWTFLELELDALED